MGNERKSHEARRIAELAAQRTAKEQRMKHPKGTSKYAKKRRSNGGKSLTWLDTPYTETKTWESVPVSPSTQTLPRVFSPVKKVQLPSGNSARVTFVHGKMVFV